MTIQRARNGGALWRKNARPTLAIALALLAALPASAANLRLLRARSAQVRATALPQLPSGALADTLHLNLDTGNEHYALQLRPKTHLGVLANRLKGRAIAYEGRLADRPGSWVAVTQIGTRWAGIWFDGLHYFGIESAAALAAISTEAAAATPGSSLVFRLSDAAWEDADFSDDTRQPTRDAEDFISLVGAELGAPASQLALLPTKRLSVALIADAALARQDGSQTETNMLAQLNIVDGIFANQVGVRVQSGSVTVFNASNDPFSSATKGDTLLEELKNYRFGSTLQRNAGVSLLMTGRNLDGLTVGIAYLDSLCSNSFSASLSEATRAVSFAALIAAHELGHVFGAPHDSEAGSACESAPTGSLMAPQLNGSQTFSSCSLEHIAPVVAAAQCLAPADAADATIEAPQAVPLALNRATDVTILVRSIGNVSVNSTNLRITLPLSLTLIDATGPAASCSNSSNVVTCALGSIAPDSAATVTLRVMATAAGNTSATLRVTASNDALRSNDTTTLQLQAAEGTDIVAVAGADALTLEIGTTTVATFAVENHGPVSVTDARLSLNIPAGLTILQQTIENTTCAAVTNGLNCGPTPLENGAAARVILTLRADALGSQVIAAVASSSQPELLSTDNVRQITLTVRNPPPPGGATATSGGGGGTLQPELLVAFAVLWVALRRQRRPGAAAQARAK